MSKLRQLGFESSTAEGAAEERVYVVRGGDGERTVQYALGHSVVATGWSALGDLSLLEDAELDDALQRHYPDDPPGRRRAAATALRTFKQIRVGDLVILPRTSQQAFAVGEVVGEYEHHAGNEDQATNCYRIQWLEQELPRELLGDLRARVDRLPAVHRIDLDAAATAIRRMLATRKPVRLSQVAGSGQEVRALFASVLTSLAAGDGAAVVELLGAGGRDVIAQIAPTDCVVSTGTGIATLAEVPWAIVRRASGPRSAQQGIYPVFLFAADGSAVFLSFNQGTENLAGGVPPLRKRALDMQRAAGLSSDGDPVRLRGSTERAKKYEHGSAYGVRYLSDQLPSDEVLRDDLQEVLGHVDAALDAGLDPDPHREPMHLLLKWSADIRPTTIEDHQAVATRRGSTWWGKFGNASMAPSKLGALRRQLADEVPTFVFLYGNKILQRTRLLDVTTDPADVDPADYPNYYNAVDCSVLFRITEFEPLDPGWALANLLLASDPEPDKVAGALSNQTTPLFVFERFVAPDAPLVPEVSLTLGWLEEQTLWDPRDLEELLNALDPHHGKGQVLLVGPPGTGKTWVAERVARFLTQDEPLKRRTVQFHPSYGYEDFVEGIRPQANEHGISFEQVPGTLLRMAAAIDGPDDVHVLVIDELNRANVPRVFGELLYLLEYRDQAIDLQLTRSFLLPSGLRLIATMNTADRSVRTIDVALRRRFEVFECRADAVVLRRYYGRQGNSTTVPALVEGFERLNGDLEGHLDRHHTIGQSFFMAPNYDRARLERTWTRQVLPLIEEYFFDQPDVVAEFTLEKYWPSAS